MNGGYKALHEMRAQGAVAAIGAGVNEWQVSDARPRGDFDFFLLAGRYTLLEQEALDPSCRSASEGHRHRTRRTLQFRHPRHRAEARRLLQLQAGADGDPGARRAHRARLRRHGVALIEAALRFPLAHPAVMSVIPGAQAPEEVASQRGDPARANTGLALDRSHGGRPFAAGRARPHLNPDTPHAQGPRPAALARSFDDAPRHGPWRRHRPRRRELSGGFDGAAPCARRSGSRSRRC